MAVFLRLAEQADASIRDEVHDTGSVLGEGFDAYIDGLVSCGATGKIPAMIELFSPHWDNNAGYCRLGRAAFKAGQHDIAEHYFLKLCDQMESYYRTEEMSMLAEIWHGRNETQRAGDLLIDCMRKLLAKIRESKYNSDRKVFAEELGTHRATYLRLFPNGESELADRGIPADPL